MARNKSPLKIRLEYYPIRLLFGILGALPWTSGASIGRILLRAILWMMPKRRQLMDQNVASCFPQLNPSERQAIIGKSIDNLAKGVALFPHLSAIHTHRIDFWAEPVGLEFMKEALAKGKGMLCFSPHYGFWEGQPIFASQFHSNVCVLARELDNPMLDALTIRTRAASGTRVIHQHKILKEGIRTLRDNGAIGILMDQNLYKGGIFVDFFGRPAATSTLISLLARRTGCAVIPMHNEWVGNKVRLIMEPAMPLSQNSDPEQAVAEDTQRMTSIMEGWIRKRPEYWLWLHNRWKRRPEPGDFVYSVDQHLLQKMAPPTGIEPVSRP